MKKAFKLIFAGIILIGIAGYFYYSSTLPLAVPVTVVSPKTARLTFTEQGIVAGIDEYSVFSAGSGPIEALNVTKGSFVNKGDILCTIDSSNYLYEISMLEASVDGYRAQISNLGTEEEKYRDSLRLNVKQLEGELSSISAKSQSEEISLDEQVRLQQLLIDRADQDFLYGYSEFEKIKTLYDSGGISKNEYDSALNRLEALEGAVTAANQQMQIILSGKTDYYKSMEDSINTQIQSINSTLGKSYTSSMASYYSSLIESAQIQIEALERKISELDITAPVAGEITLLTIENTNLVAAGGLIAAIKPENSISGKKIEVYVSTKDIHEIAVGDYVEVVVKRQSEDDIIEAVVESVEGEAVTKLSALGVEERRVKVTAVFDDSADLLWPGYDADVRFTTYMEENKLAVPKTAIFKSGGQDTVFIIRDGIIEEVPIRTGVTLKTEVIVEEGISAGDMVVTDADKEGLKNGVKAKNEGEDF